MFLAFDADITLFRAATAAETEVDWGDDIWTLYTDLNDAKQAFENQINHVMKTLGVEDYVCCLSDHSRNFRKEVDPTYKSNRKGTRKPVGYVALCSWVEENFRTFRKSGLEADDCLGILATKPENVGKCIMVSDDKDLKTVNGLLYRPTSGEKMEISLQEADYNFFTQVLTGDPTDGYKGVHGIGPKKAQAILGSRPTWENVKQAFLKANMTEEQAIQQARLARILRWSDWNDKKKEIRLWTP